MPEAKMQQLYKKFKDNLSPDFELTAIHEVYFPFQYCKAKVTAEIDLQLDGMSKIVLDFVNLKPCAHLDICEFLGIAKDSFLNSHIHFLIREGYLIEEYAPHTYKITPAGRDFLQGFTKPSAIEMLDVDFHYNPMLKCFFDPDQPIDSSLSAAKKSNFQGYRLIKTDKIEPNGHKFLPFKYQPRILDLERAAFAKWFNFYHKNYRFYDLESDKPRIHKRSISFLVLEFEEEGGRKCYEVRRHEKTLISFTANDLEEMLTEAFSKFMVENPSFLA